MPLSIEIVMSFMAETPTTIWGMMKSEGLKHISEASDCELGAEQCIVGDVANRLEESSRPHFGLVVDGLKIAYGQVASGGHSLVTINGLDSGIENADSWVMPFHSSAGFIQAWAFDEDYDYWQNAYDPLQYTARKKSYRGLPMKSNGLPYPLLKDIIDTSRNPGRRVIRNGYVECVGSVMWLGREFLTRTGLAEETLTASSWLNARWIDARVVRIQVADKPFTSTRWRQGRLQRKLRAVLYPNRVGK